MPSVKTHLKGTRWELMEKINENKTKELNSLLLHFLRPKIGNGVVIQFLEREGVPSL